MIKITKPAEEALGDCHCIHLVYLHLREDLTDEAKEMFTIGLALGSIYDAYKDSGCPDPGKQPTVQKIQNIECFLLSHLPQEGCTSENMMLLLYTIPADGIIRIYKKYVLYQWKGVEVHGSPRLQMSINGRILHDAKWSDIDDFFALRDKVCEMFDYNPRLPPNPPIHLKMSALRRVINKGKEDLQADRLMSMSLQLNEMYLRGEIDLPQWKDVPTAQDYIIDEYLEHLWKSQEDGKMALFIQCFENWMEDQWDSWARGEERKVLQNRVFTEEHQSLLMEVLPPSALEELFMKHNMMGEPEEGVTLNLLSSPSHLRLVSAFCTL